MIVTSNTNLDVDNGYNSNTNLDVYIGLIISILTWMLVKGK